MLSVVLEMSFFGIEWNTRIAHKLKLSKWKWVQILFYAIRNSQLNCIRFHYFIIVVIWSLLRLDQNISKRFNRLKIRIEIQITKVLDKQSSCKLTLSTVVYIINFHWRTKYGQIYENIKVFGLFVFVCHCDNRLFWSNGFLFQQFHTMQSFVVPSLAHSWLEREKEKIGSNRLELSYVQSDKVETLHSCMCECFCWVKTNFISFQSCVLFKANV